MSSGGGGAVLFNENGRSFLFGGNIRYKDIDALYDDWMDLVALLTPNLQMAFEINRASAGRTREALAHGGTRRHSTPVMVVDGRRLLLCADAAARHLLDEGGDRSPGRPAPRDVS
ncbi:MAG: hypothetical protein KDK08_25480 [Rhizobiaceae bacterium]|nr:hypothetical protein [Rhizobiaceae bacterium]